MIYAMSYIHGCMEELKDKMDQVDLRGDNRMIFLGDYMDYGESSFQVLQYIWELQKQYGDEKIIVLKGNHEQMFLEWIKNYATCIKHRTSKPLKAYIQGVISGYRYISGESYKKLTKL